MTDDERQQVLKMIRDGKITAEEGLKLIQALDADVSAQETDIIETAAHDRTQTGTNNSPEFDRKINRFRRLWLVPLSVGILITVASAYWMYSAVQGPGLGFWFYCSWLPFLLGIAAIALGFDSRTSRWIYIDIHQKPGEQPQRILLTFPLSPVRWLASLFGNQIPAEQKGAVDDVMRAIFKSSQSQEPLFVEVHEDDGEHVQVYIG